MSQRRAVSRRSAVSQGSARAIGLLVAVALLVAACGLRTPSGVRVDQRSVDTAADNPDIRKLPPGPAPGASPEQIVSGFLEASAADPDHSFALEFLTPAASWASRDSAVIYQPESVSALKTTKTATGSVVRFVANGLGTISTGGAFLPAEQQLALSFELRRTSGQWRLSKVPAGVLLTPRDLTRSYRPVRTYGFSPDGSVLVAEPGYVVSDRAGLASAALHALLNGWGNAAAAVASGLPPGLTSLGSVVVRDGEATVDLGREAFTVAPSRRSRVVALIAASLASAPGVFTVRVLVEERPYAGGPVNAEIPANLAAVSVGPLLAIGTDGRLVSIDEGRSERVRWTARGPQPDDPGPLLNPVSAPSGKWLAATRLTALGNQLILAEVGAGTAVTGTPAPVTATVHHVAAITGVPDGAAVLRPQWLDRDRLLLVVGGSNPRLELVNASTGRTHLVYAPNLRSLGSLSAFSLSRDGTRAIAVAGAPGARKVFLARVATASTQPGSAAQLIVDGWTQVPTSLADVAAVSWSGDLAVTVLGMAARSAGATGALRVESVSLDGVPDPTDLPALPAAIAVQALAGGGAIALTAAPDRSPLIGTGSGSWTRQGGGWVEIGAWRSPAYP